MPFRKLTADRLAAGLSTVLRPEYRERATALAARVTAEDGAAAVVAAVDRLSGT